MNDELFKFPEPSPDDETPSEQNPGPDAESSTPSVRGTVPLDLFGQGLDDEPAPWSPAASQSGPLGLGGVGQPGRAGEGQPRPEDLLNGIRGELKEGEEPARKGSGWLRAVTDRLRGGTGSLQGSREQAGIAAGEQNAQAEESPKTGSEGFRGRVVRAGANVETRPVQQFELEEEQEAKLHGPVERKSSLPAAKPNLREIMAQQGGVDERGFFVPDEFEPPSPPAQPVKPAAPIEPVQLPAEDRPEPVPKKATGGLRRILTEIFSGQGDQGGQDDTIEMADEEIADRLSSGMGTGQLPDLPAGGFARGPFYQEDIEHLPEEEPAGDGFTIYTAPESSIESEPGQRDGSDMRLLFSNEEIDVTSEPTDREPGLPQFLHTNILGDEEDEPPEPWMGGLERRVPGLDRLPLDEQAPEQPVPEPGEPYAGILDESRLAPPGGKPGTGPFRKKKTGELTGPPEPHPAAGPDEIEEDRLAALFAPETAPDRQAEPELPPWREPEQSQAWDIRSGEEPAEAGPNFEPDVPAAAGPAELQVDTPDISPGEVALEDDGSGRRTGRQKVFFDTGEIKLEPVDLPDGRHEVHPFDLRHELLEDETSIFEGEQARSEVEEELPGLFAADRDRLFGDTRPLPDDVLDRPIEEQVERLAPEVPVKPVVVEGFTIYTPGEAGQESGPDWLEPEESTPEEVEPVTKPAFRGIGAVPVRDAGASGADLRSMLDDNEEDLEQEEENRDALVAPLPASSEYGASETLRVPDDTLERQTTSEKITHWLRGLKRREKIAIAVGIVVSVAMMMVGAFLALRLLVTRLAPERAAVGSPEAVDVNQPHPVGVELTGGWYFELETGLLDAGEWKPDSAEWLAGSEVRKVLALPWNRQSEAVIQTLQRGDPVRLFSSTGRIETYKVARVERVTVGEVDILDGRSPSLVIILYQEEASERWIVICNP